MHNDEIHPELRAAYARMPTLPMHNRLLVSCAKLMLRIMPVPQAGPGVTIEPRQLETAAVRIYRPAGALSGAGLLWIHGGGLIVGQPAQDDRRCAALARDLGLIVVSVKYRLAPEHKYPKAIDDCFEAWQWLQRSARELGVDPARIAIAGQSAGGGLAACLAQRILDARGVQPAAQLLFCPMLDDRTALRHELDAIKYPLWPNRSNRAGWSWYLDQPAGAAHAFPYASASRRENLAGLPPTWISVGDIELFYDEDRLYAERLRAAGVPCELRVVPRAPHAFESIAPDASPSRELMQSAYLFLDATLALSRGSARVA